MEVNLPTVSSDDGLGVAENLLKRQNNLVTLYHGYPVLRLFIFRILILWPVFSPTP
jgi:hypothetical protein